MSGTDIVPLGNLPLKLWKRESSPFATVAYPYYPYAILGRVAGEGVLAYLDRVGHVLPLGIEWLITVGGTFARIVGVSVVHAFI